MGACWRSLPVGYSPLIKDRPYGFASHLQKETFLQCWLTKSKIMAGACTQNELIQNYFHSSF
ncbi:asr3309 [Nostoc sp. PCC 7120 = FACHB-418]|nr:asr3309 [Nostoc sp. PCC 7120 = FACHB-418]